MNLLRTLWAFSMALAFIFATFGWMMMALVLAFCRYEDESLRVGEVVVVVSPPILLVLMIVMATVRDRRRTRLRTL